ncbi:MAG: hypothetical protein B7Z46_00315 [Hydrogenophilales bacterium 12-64-6]|nr:MAG: hypothetical protein B7Z46_00315 [Hydrogenophilales bacterium 12-64-6]
MRFFRLFLSGLWLCAFAAHAGIPDYQDFSASGRLAALVRLFGDEAGHQRPGRDLILSRLVEVLLIESLRAAQASGKQVVVFAVARAAVPVLRAAALLESERRNRLCVVLMHPNLYTTAEPLDEPAYLDLGDLSGLRVRVLQPRRSAATPWLPGLLDHLARHGATVSDAILENLREGYWARETPTDFEIAESRRMDAMLLHQLETWGCK